MTTLPQWAGDILATPPRAGEGFHTWLFRAALALWKCNRTEHDIRAILENAASTCERRVTAREIEDAINDSRTGAFQPGNFAQPRWPALDPELRQSIIKKGGGVVDLWEGSPARLDDNKSHTEEIIDALFPGNPLLCCGKTMSDFDTKPREDWAGELSKLQLIVPSPMSAVTGLTLDGRESKHTLNNTGPRRFLVIEFDKGTADEHAAVLLHLAQFAPMVLALHSGSKSMHGWFYAGGCGATDTKVEKSFGYAVALGADRALWSRCQLVRMPDGIRDNGKKQTVFFFDWRPPHV